MVLLLKAENGNDVESSDFVYSMLAIECSDEDVV